MSEWENVAAEARRYDRAWLKEQLDQRNVTTLRLYVATAGISVGSTASGAFSTAEFFVSQGFDHKEMSSQECLKRNAVATCRRRVFVHACSGGGERAMNVVPAT